MVPKTLKSGHPMIIYRGRNPADSSLSRVAPFCLALVTLSPYLKTNILNLYRLKIFFY